MGAGGERWSALPALNIGRGDTNERPKDTHGRIAPQGGDCTHMSRIDSWLPLDIADFISADTRLSDRAAAARTRFLVHAWLRGGVLPMDDAALSRIARMKRNHWEPALAEFTATPEGYIHPKLQSERKTAKWISEQRAEAGRKGGQAKAREAGKPVAIATENSKQLLSHACSVDSVDIPTTQAEVRETHRDISDISTRETAKVVSYSKARLKRGLTDGGDV